MRGSLVAVLVALMVAATAIAWWSGAFATAEPPLAPEPGTASSNVAKPLAATPRPRDPGASVLGPNLVATRTTPPDLPADKLADAPTACLRVVDRTSQQPLAGAPIRRLQGGNEIAFTDERGFAAVALREPEQLAVVVDGYLLRLVPTRLGTSEAEPQLVTMVRDEWSLVRRFEFRAPGGAAVAEAFVRFKARVPTPKGARSPVPATDAVAVRAWDEHTMLATLPVTRDVPVQLGSFAADRVHRLAADAAVRFLAAGDYVIDVATTSGLVARSDVHIDAAAQANAPPIQIALTEGAFAVGTVEGLGDGKPIAGASITLAGGEPLGLVATSAADGKFRFGPLIPDEVRLLVRHGDHEAKSFGPLRVPAEDVRIALTPLPTTTVRGRVRSRPGLRPLAGATVSWTPNATSPVVATTDGNGMFSLPATGKVAARLAVQALGYVAYAELVEPGAPFADYDVWPADPQERLAQSLSAMLEGIVVDAEGRPLAGRDVRWQPAQRAAPAGLPGRRVLEGGLLELPLGARSGDDGAFRIETNAFGEGRLVLGDANGPGIDTTANAGRTTSGLRLTP